MKRLKQPAPIPPGHIGITDWPILRLPFPIDKPGWCEACQNKVDTYREHDCPQMQKWIWDNNPNAFEEVPE